MRDILVGRDDQGRHERRARFIADRWFDAVHQHGDPTLSRFDETFGETLAIPVHHTGFVTAARPSGRPVAPGRVLASAGGGAVGEPLLTAALHAQALVAADGFTLRIVAGPLMAPDALARLQALAAVTPGAEIVPVVPDLVPELEAAAVSVSQCGYNTALEVAGAGVPAIVVPYSAGSEDEQRRRAAALAARGGATVLDADGLDPAALAAAIRAAAVRARVPVELPVDGAARSAQIIDEALGEPT